jgi:hypothetical protein
MPRLKQWSGKQLKKCACEEEDPEAAFSANQLALSKPGASMPKAIDAAMVEARSRDLAATTVSQTVSLFKGGTFALAAVVLIEIAFSPDDRTLRLVLWTSTLFMTMTSYNAWIHSTVTLFREGAGNILAMILQGMLELMLFAVLTPRAIAQSWRAWALIAAVFFLVTGVRLAIRMNAGLAVAPSIAPLFALAQKNRVVTSRAVLAASLVNVVVAAPVLAVPLGSPWPKWLSFALALFNMAHACIAMVQQEKERAAMEAMLEDAAAG